MSELLRKLMGWGPCEGADGGDEGGGGGGGGDSTVDDGSGSGNEGSEEGGKKVETITDASMTEGMATAISGALKPDEGGEKKEPAKKVEAKPKPGAAEPTAEEKAAAEAAAKKKADDDAKAQEKKDLDAVKGKQAKDFVLSPEEKKALGAKAQQRFHELTTYAKQQEGIARNATAKVEQLTGQAQAATALVEVLEEHHCSPDDLKALLHYNKLFRTGDMEGALRFINGTRNMILKRLNREEPGVDLLKDHPDLSAKVEANEMSREAALEVVKGRNATAAEEARQNRERQNNDASNQQAERQERALAMIDKWSRGKKATDIDYAKKEAIILPKLKGILAKYPPSHWQQAIDDAYESIVLTKEPKPANEEGGGKPLRPSGGSGGNKVPGSAEEAIAQAVGVSIN